MFVNHFLNFSHPLARFTTATINKLLFRHFSYCWLRVLWLANKTVPQKRYFDIPTHTPYGTYLYLMHSNEIPFLANSSHRKSSQHTKFAQSTVRGFFRKKKTITSSRKRWRYWNDEISMITNTLSNANTWSICGILYVCVTWVFVCLCIFL